MLMLIGTPGNICKVCTIGYVVYIFISANGKISYNMSNEA